MTSKYNFEQSGTSNLYRYGGGAAAARRGRRGGGGGAARALRLLRRDRAAAGPPARRHRARRRAPQVRQAGSRPVRTSQCIFELYVSNGKRTNRFCKEKFPAIIKFLKHTIFLLQIFVH